MARIPSPKRYAAKKLYVLKGRTINDMWAAIRANRTLAGNGLQARQTGDGTQLNIIDDLTRGT